MKNRLTMLTKYLLDLFFYTGIFVTLTLPATIKFYGQYNRYFGDNYWRLVALFFFSGIFALLIIYELRLMFRTIIKEDCFISENVRSLRRMGTYSFIIAFLTAGRLLLYITPAVVIVIVIFIIAGLFSKVLSLVFEQAVTYKQENDFTI